MTVFTCDHCGSKNVACAVWYLPNEKKVSADDPPTSESEWCNDCNQGCEIVENDDDAPRLKEFTAIIASDAFWVTYKVRALDEEKAREMLEHECDHCQGADERAGEIGRAATYSIRKIEFVGPADADEIEADITQIDAGGNG